MENKIKIIGFSGKLGVGKNYISEKIFGKKLYDMGYTVHILAIADQTKYELGSRFKIVDDENNFTKEMNEIFDELFINKSADARKKLQYYATDYCRNGGNWIINNDFIMYNEPLIWIKGLYLQIKNILNKSYDVSKDVFIITDVRFVNEAQFIKSLGGIVIRIESEIRNYKKMKDEAFKNCSSEKDIDKIIQLIKNHTSETNLDIYTFNYTINNEPDITENIASEIDLIIDTFIRF